MKKIIVIRGVSSSGKSHYAMKIAKNNSDIIFSADKFFGETKEEYIKKFNTDDLYIAHCVCRRKVKEAIERNEKLIVVDNTNITIQEVFPYYELAIQNSYGFELKEPDSKWWKEIKVYLTDKKKYGFQIEETTKFLWKMNQNTHCVPYQKIYEMLMKYQTIGIGDLDRKFKSRSYLL